MNIHRLDVRGHRLARHPYRMALGLVALMLLAAAVSFGRFRADAVPSTPAPGASPFALSPPPGFNSHELRFEDSFSTAQLDQSKWSPYIASRGSNGMPWGGNGRQGSSLDSPFSRSTQDYDLPSQTAIHKGLVLTAVKRRTIGRLGSRRAVYPWRSGIVSTYRKFEFMGGYVQVEAKVPTSPGMWPAIWMLPGSSSANAGDNYEVDIFEGGYNLVHANPQDTYAWHLITPTGKVGGVVDVHRNLGDGFLVYGMRWIPKKSITWYLNGSAVAKVTQSQASIPAEPMDLILDLGVAAPSTSGFRTVPNQGTTSPSSMIVDKVQVYSSSRKSAG